MEVQENGSAKTLEEIKIYRFYHLIDKRNQQIFYVGLTTMSLKKRLTKTYEKRDHWKSFNSKKSIKMREVGENNIEIVLIGEWMLTHEKALQLERDFIKAGRQAGFNLTNHQKP